MLQSVFSYIKYFFSAKSKYAIHSPFVYDFITKGLESKVDLRTVKDLNLYKDDLKKSKEIIEVTDFGAGSKVFKSNKREVSKIAKYAGISNTKATLLQKIIFYFKPKSILEIGTSLGIGSVAMASVNDKVTIQSLEGCPETAKTANSFLKKHGFNTVNIKVGEFSRTLPQLLNKTYDLIYFDGNHKKKPTIDYFEMSLKAIHNDSLFIFDDIHWSKEMEEAWAYIQNHEKVSVTIDLFHMGLVFFRKEQVKQNFIIRT